WYNEIKKFCGDIPVVLFGNKVDLVDEKELDDEKVLKVFAKKEKTFYIETSAKTGEKVEEAFFNLAQRMLKNVGYK
ncbi:MAG: hypothetical protein KAT57_07840, partial [Candidatus Lokiarchaeota archaeon]|nr:hypothetical protein [Candidatus Lokiarchaeota archaeon]